MREFTIGLRVECRFVRGFIELDRLDIKFMGFVLIWLLKHGFTRATLGGTISSQLSENQLA